MTTPITQPQGRRVAQIGFVFGSLTSVAANVLHTFLPGVHMPNGLALTIAARIAAGIWPVGLLLSVEVLSRVAWRRGPGWSLARFGGAGAVALGSAVISYSHVRDVLLAWGYGHPAAEVGPLTLDGLMVVCGFALLSLTPPNTSTPNRSDIPANIGVEPSPVVDPKAVGLREIPLAAQIEALSAPVHLVAEAVSAMPGQADIEAVEADSGADMEADSRRQHARELHAQDWTHAQIATELGVSKRTVRRYLAVTEDTTPDRDSAAVAGDRADTFGADWFPASDIKDHTMNGAHA